MPENQGEINQPISEKPTLRQRAEQLIGDVRSKLGELNLLVPQLKNETKAATPVQRTWTNELVQTSQEIVGNEQRFLHHEQWKNFVLNEQMHEEGVFNNDHSESGQIAHHIYCVGDYSTFNLREERVDENGNPHLICLDEQNDTEVVQNATPAERRTSVVVAINRMLERSWSRTNYWFEPQDVNKPAALDNFYVAASSYATIVGGMNQEEAHQHITEALTKHRELTFQVTPEHQKRIASVLKRYQEFITTTPLEEKREYHDLTDVMTNEGLHLEIEGEQYEAPSNHGPFLDERSLEMIKPLQEANHRSRAAMINAAKQFAREHLGADEELLNRVSPPDWFLEKCSNDRGIISREFLMYITSNNRPIGLQGEKFDLNAALNAANEQPKILSFIDELMGDEYRRSQGWNLIRLSDSDRPCIVAIDHLTS